MFFLPQQAHCASVPADVELKDDVLSRNFLLCCKRKKLLRQNVGTELPYSFTLTHHRGGVGLGAYSGSLQIVARPAVGSAALPARRRHACQSSL